MKLRMGTAQRRQREKTELRDRILRAAREIVVREGYGALTVRKIAEAIEYAPATLYLYFDGRDAIARELATQGFQELLAAFAPAQRIEHPLERLAAVGRAYVHFGMRHPETYRLMFMEDPQLTKGVLQEAASDPGQRAYQALVEPLEALRASGRLAPKADVQVLADAAWCLVHGIVSLKLTCPGFPVTPVEQLVDTALRTLLAGLAGGEDRLKRSRRG
jgi:AcrR family transcriptional regulator